MVNFSKSKRLKCKASMYMCCKWAFQDAGGSCLIRSLGAILGWERVDKEEQTTINTSILNEHICLLDKDYCIIIELK